MSFTDGFAFVVLILCFLVSVEGCVVVVGAVINAFKMKKDRFYYTLVIVILLIGIIVQGSVVLKLLLN